MDNIIIEIIKDDIIKYFRIKYVKDGKSYIKYFSEDLNIVFQNGKKEIKANGIQIEFDEEVKHDDFTVLNSTIINNMSEISSTMITDNNIKKNNQLLIDDKNINNQNVEELSKPIINNSFYTCQNTIVAADYGVGKNFLTIEVARLGLEQGLIKLPCFFNLEDMNDNKYQRYTNVFNDNFQFVSPDEWKKYLDEYRKNIDTNSKTYAIGTITSINGKRIDEYYNIVKRKNKEKGINDVGNYRIDAFIELMNEKIKQGCDFIVVDSLSELFLDERNINVVSVNKILESKINKDVTLIIIHHLSINNNKYDVSGRKSIKRKFDNVYFLINHPKLSEGTDAILELRIIKKNDPEHNKGFFLKRTIKNRFVANYQIMDNELIPSNETKNTIYYKILNILNLNIAKSVYEITVEEIEQLLPDTNKRSIKNELINLSNNGYIRMKEIAGKRKVWDVIEILKK